MTLVLLLKAFSSRVKSEYWPLAGRLDFELWLRELGVPSYCSPHPLQVHRPPPPHMKQSSCHQSVPPPLIWEIIYSVTSMFNLTEISPERPGWLLA